LLPRSTTDTLSRATSVPEPMAIPTLVRNTNGGIVLLVEGSWRERMCEHAKP
jgi:hypothetical protein